MPDNFDPNKRQENGSVFSSIDINPFPNHNFSDTPSVAPKTDNFATPNIADSQELIMDIPVNVQIVLGSTTMPVASLMNLKRGSIISLDAALGDPVDIVVNGKVIAQGELVPVENDPSRFGVSLISILNKR